MTEEEAKTKWCPFAKSRVVSMAQSQGTGVTQTVWSLSDKGSPDLACIGSACMAWRNEYEHDGTFNTTLEGPRLDVTARIPNFRPTAHGYCGLAGSPR